MSDNEQAETAGEPLPAETPEATSLTSPSEGADPVDAEPVSGFGIGRAVKEMRNGARVRRAGWNGTGMFLFLVPGSTFQVNRPPLLGMYPEGTEINYQPHVDMKTAQGTVVPWLCSQTDLLATDWELARENAA